MYIYAVIIIHNGRFRFLPSISSLTSCSRKLSQLPVSAAQVGGEKCDRGYERISIMTTSFTPQTKLHEVRQHVSAVDEVVRGNDAAANLKRSREPTNEPEGRLQP